MRLLNKATSLILGLMIRPLMLLVQLYARFACRFRGQALPVVMCNKTFLSRACIFENIQSM